MMALLAVREWQMSSPPAPEGVQGLLRRVAGLRL